MESQNNIFNMVNEMGSILLTLQENMIKVMNGITQLNLIISKIKQCKTNNNMINNMMNNMTNNIQNINMGMNNMMNIPNMQMPMNNVMNNNINIFNKNPILQNNWNLIFEEHISKKIFTINISKQQFVKEAINKYLLKSGRNEKLKYIFNAHNLNPESKIVESGLENFSKILVVSEADIICG